MSPHFSFNHRPRILVLRYRFLGDTVLALPFLRNLRLARPEAAIEVLVDPVAGDVLADCSDHDGLIRWYYSRPIPPSETRPACHGLRAAARYLRARGYERVYILRRSFASALLPFLARIPQRIGFGAQGRSLLLTRAVPYREAHEAECFLDLLRADGVPIVETCPVNRAHPSAIAAVAARWPAPPSGPAPHHHVLVCATTTNAAKTWPAARWAELVAWLANERRCQVHFSGAPGDSDYYAALRRAIAAPLAFEPIDWCRTLDLRQSLALFPRMDLAVGVDNGLLHVAASFRVPVVALFGPMDPVRWRPWGTDHAVLQATRDCVPCNLAHECPHAFACMTDLAVAAVQHRIDALLARPATAVAAAAPGS